MREPIILWFDFASPYAYFAMEAAEELAAAHEREIAWRPILLWAVLKAQSIPSPVDPPAKHTYFQADIARSADFHGVAYGAPSKFPLSSHLAARFYYAVVEREPGRARALRRDLFAAYFAQNIDISRPAALASIASAQGVTAEASRAALDDEIGRRRLAEANDAAVAAGVCGSPWFVLDGEAFFGADRIPQIAWRLSGAKATAPAQRRGTEQAHG